MPDASGAVGLGQVTFASKFGIGGGKASVAREDDGALQVIEVALLGIVTADLRLSEPRYALLPSRHQCQEKLLEEKTPADYGVDMTSRLDVVSTREPEGRKACIKVGSVDELLGRLE